MANRPYLMRSAAAAWLGMLTISAVGLAQEGDAPLPTRDPQHVVPMVDAEHAPRVDGRVEPREWAYAAQLSPLLDHASGQTDQDRTVVYLTYTSERLYVGWQVYRSPEAGPMLLAAGRSGAQESHIWSDDAVELLLDPGRTAQRAINFVGNAEGASADGMASPTVNIASNWNWDYQATQTDWGWQGELSIAFADLGLEGAPEPGSAWGFDFVRSDKTPARRIAMWGYRMRWHDMRHYGQLRFLGPAPAVRILQAGQVGQSLMGALVEIINPTDAEQPLTIDYALYRQRDDDPLNYLAQVDAGTSSDQEAGGYTMASADDQVRSLLETRYEAVVPMRHEQQQVAAGARLPLNLTLGDCPPGQYVFAYRISDAQQRVLSSSLLPAVKRSALELQVTPYYLGPNVLAVKATVHDTKLAERIHEVRYQLEQDGQVRQQQKVEHQQAVGGIDLPAAAIAPGAYRLLATAFDADGQEVAQAQLDLFRPEPPFWAVEDHGVSAFVPEPWTSVRASDDAVEVWGRTYELGGRFLPRQMTAVGEPLFAAPPRLRMKVDGREVELHGELRLSEQDDEQATYTWRGRAGDIPIEATTRVEFDGFVTLDLTLQTRQATVDELTVEFPLHAEHSKLFTRHNFLFPPGKQEQRPEAGGRVGDGLAMGFTYAVWLGSTERGFQWCAETYEHWHNADRTRSIEVEPTPDATILRLRVIDTPTRTGEQLSYRWGLIATPVRPRPQREHSVFYLQGGIGFDFPNDPQQVATFDYSIRFAKAMGANWYNCWSSWNPDFFGQPLLEDPAQIDRAKLMVRMLHDAGLRCTVYAGWNSLTPKMKDWPFFGQAMTHKPQRFSHGGYGQCARGGYEDYLVNGIAWMIRELGIDGVYLDSTAWPHPCTDPHHGCGFVDPQTGQRLPTANIWSNRRMFKRIYKLLHGEMLQDGLLYSHAGQVPLLAVESFIDVKHCGEGAYTATSFEEYYNLDHYLARYNSRQYGWPIEHTFNNKAPMPRNAVWGAALLHDNAIKMYGSAVLHSWTRDRDYTDRHGIDWRMWVPEQWFDWSTQSQWHPYYSNESLLTVSDPAVRASFHHNEADQILLYMMNFSQDARRVNVHFDPSLQLPSLMHARDAVTGEAFEVHGGRMTLELLGQRPRVLMLAAEPVPAVELDLPPEPPRRK